MKKLKDQLKTIQKSLVSLSKQVEKVSKQVEKLEAAKAAKKAAPKKKAAKKKVAKAKVAKKKAAPAKNKVAAPKAKKTAASKSTVLDKVLDVVKKSRAGATIAKLKENTGLDSRQLSNALYKLSKRGVIVAKSRGLYTKK
jgi:hypothetical protein